MDSSFTIYIGPAKDPIPVFKWRSWRKHVSSLQQGYTVARYVTNHFQGRTISLAICSFAVRRSSNAIIVQNVTVGKRNWKSTNPVTMEVWDRPLCSVHIVWNISPEIIHWSIMPKFAWKNPLVQQNLIWKTQCSNWFLLKKQYRQKVEVGEIVSTLLNSNEDLSEESLTGEYKKGLKLYRQSQVQRVQVYKNAMLKPWQKKVMTFIQQPTHREVIWVIGQQGGEGKSFLQNYIKYHCSDRRVITTDFATGTKDIAHYLSKFPLECKDIFLFNHPCSTAETIA